MNGEHEEHYQINGTALDGVHERMNEDRLEKDFIEVSKVSKPKIVYELPLIFPSPERRTAMGRVC